MRKNGFTLLEVLVAMLVLSIGLIGLAGMMASTLRNNHSAYHRTQATWLAYDIIDRMRANRTVALNNSYNISIGATAAATEEDSPMVIQDLNAWKTALSAALPGGDGSIAVVPATRAVTVVVQWNDARGTGGGAAQQFRVDTQL
ncbi:type IV pilus modification protein PilV [Thauera sinica]|uniref:Type IV pilus modification protein PilV n=1 Tax=Thauera sinica TaxID=2665146 RepID=A0ABW1AVX3_9RHOO|nr:type IV pilus modification protein PilV [Thauera sp. K11]